ncbi:hypothetical protein E3N88_29696 [Mikania micrantha]|uniref:Uncharacterized protein n=1 Tax=Mikania micrantha TaxID=192012 RepID=A0A5N6MK02_9ASTR|nr:hypothetical protein E3N88_29696 [Mikania micrantha]
MGFDCQQKDERARLYGLDLRFKLFVRMFCVPIRGNMVVLAERLGAAMEWCPRGGGGMEENNIGSVGEGVDEASEVSVEGDVNFGEMGGCIGIKLVNDDLNIVIGDGSEVSFLGAMESSTIKHQMVVKGTL